MPPCAVEKGEVPLLWIACLGLLPAMMGISDGVTLSFALCIILLVRESCVVCKCLWGS